MALGPRQEVPLAGATTIQLSPTHYNEKGLTGRAPKGALSYCVKNHAIIITMDQKQYIDYSIEYSHIYTNEAFSNEHKQSVAKLKNYLPQLEGKSVDKVVFIDNYNSTEHLLDIDRFLQSIKEEGVTHDYYVFEADMAPYKDMLLDVIENDKIRREYDRYITNKDKIPCSFMTAVWYLIRLGFFPLNDGIIHGKNSTEFLPARKVINVLPERFRSVELKALELVGSTKYGESIKDIDFLFFDSSI